MPLLTGQVLNNRYRIVKLLGQGGFGAVYRAWDVQMAEACAVKENLDTSIEAQEQFVREARLLFKLRHPSLPVVYDQFNIPGQGQYLVMDYIDGDDLQAMLDAAPNSPLPSGKGAGGLGLPESQVLPWILQVCEALAYLHSQTPPVIHRDIKPANIKITPKGQAVLVDFGIAKVYDPAMKTATAARAVTPGYSPQEQYTGLGTGPYSDVYALGATLYALLTGTQPAESVARNLGNVLQPPRTLNPAISPRVEAAILKAMAMQPGDRYPRMVDFTAALKASPAAAAAPPAQQAMVYTAPTVQARAGRPAAPPTAAGTKKRPTWLFGIIGLAFIGVIAVAFIIGKGISGGGGNRRTATAPAVLADRLTPSAVAIPDSPTATIPLGATSLPARLSDDFGVAMALVPAGPFQMGGGLENGDELPVHTVELDAFYMDIYEVTNASYTACEQAGACTPPSSMRSYTHSRYYNRPLYASYPVMYVDWKQAVDYCAWRGARLPTEAEWEKAARGGLEGKLYPWGDEAPVCKKGASTGSRFNDEAGCWDCDTEAVGSYTANGYGLFDMAGNVWEWVNDWYQEDYYNSSPISNPTGPESGSSRVIRGGSWVDFPVDLRTAARANHFPSDSDMVTGFRCAWTP